MEPKFKPRFNEKKTAENLSASLERATITPAYRQYLRLFKIPQTRATFAIIANISKHKANNWLNRFLREGLIKGEYRGSVKGRPATYTTTDVANQILKVLELWNG